jgi:hypothetical protein
MLILPIVNRNRVMSVQIKIKNAEKIRTEVRYDDADESEIIINTEKFSNSGFVNDKSKTAPIDFVRSRSLLYPRNFLITTKERDNSKYYDLYEVGQPLRKVNDGLDELYSKAITDMRMEVPGHNRGRYISFKELGLDKDLTEEKIGKIQRIVKEEDRSNWPRLFEEAGVSSIIDTINFINTFDARVISDTTIPEDSLNSVLKALEIINTRDSRNLRKFYNTALDNKEIYAKLSYINKIVYNRPFLIKTKNERNKQLIKSINESEHKNAA